MKLLVLLVPNLLPLCLAIVLSAQTPAPQRAATKSERDAEIRELHQELDRVAGRLSVLEAEGHHVVPRGIGPDTATVSTPATTAPAIPADTSASANPARTLPIFTPADAPTLSFFRGTTISAGVDGYYGYNFNDPVGRVNLLRAYDVSSNSFSLNQVSVIVERVPSTESRIGGRLDLQFGQATETLQGSSVNEQRPQVWRNLFQGIRKLPGTGRHGPPNRLWQVVQFSRQRG